MKASTFTAVVVLTATALAGTAVLAKSGDRGGRMSFEQFDTNNDGQITQDEIAAMRSERFAKADTDGDGFITLDELTAQSVKRAEERAAGMMEKLDTDGDGKLSEEDMAQSSRAGRMFERLDQDNDGVITKAEFDEARKHGGKRWGKKRAAE